MKQDLEDAIGQMTRRIRREAWHLVGVEIWVTWKSQDRLLVYRRLAQCVEKLMRQK